MAARLLSTSVSSSASDIPTDVKFLFKEEEDGNVTTKEIKVHKFILALVSDVFRMGFYGGFPDNGSIEIEDVKKEAFEAMINYIYNKEVDLGTYDLSMLCTLYCLGDKYNINILVEESLDAIRRKDIVTTNILIVGHLADHYSIYEKLVDTLYDSAAQSLSKIFDGDLTKVSKFFSEISADASTSPSAMTLVKIMGKIKKPPVCTNCMGSPCQSGSKVTKDNFVPNAEVKLVASVSLTGKTVLSDPLNETQFVLKKPGPTQVLNAFYSVHYNEGEPRKLRFEEDYEYVYNC